MHKGNRLNARNSLRRTATREWRSRRVYLGVSTGQAKFRETSEVAESRRQSGGTACAEVNNVLWFRLKDNRIVKSPLRQNPNRAALRVVRSAPRCTDRSPYATFLEYERVFGRPFRRFRVAV